MIHHAEIVQNFTAVPVNPLFGMTSDQLLMMVLVVVLVSSHMFSRLIVSEIRERRAVRRTISAMRAERALYDAQHSTYDVKESDVRR